MWSSLPERAVRPSGKNATEKTTLECPVKVRSSLPVAMSQVSAFCQCCRKVRCGRRGKDNRPDRAGMSSEGAKLLASGNVPEFQRFVPTAGKRGPAIWGKRNREDVGCISPAEMSREGAKLLAGGNVPEFQRIVRTAGKSGAAIWGKRHRPDTAGTSHEGAKLLAGGNVPEFQRLVFAAGKSDAAIRGKGDRVDIAECPVKVRSSLPVAISQSFSVLSSLPERAVRPSGEKATTQHIWNVPEGAKHPRRWQRPRVSAYRPGCRKERCGHRGKGNRDGPAGMSREGADRRSLICRQEIHPTLPASNAKYTAQPQLVAVTAAPMPKPLSMPRRVKRPPRSSLIRAFAAAACSA